MLPAFGYSSGNGLKCNKNGQGIAGPYADVDVECATNSAPATPPLERRDQPLPSRPLPPPKSTLRKGKACELSHPLSLEPSDILREYLDQCQDAWGRKSWLEAERSLREATELWGGDCPLQWCVWGIQIAMAQSAWEEVTNFVEIAEHLHPYSADIRLASTHVSLITDRLPESMASL
ncbi:hypothetical protein FRB95_011405 [Tulasnella sp. JGI-2019a]|nr:hypothetical protein FRB95_011405 [Tulasnella sp. JGI-2019a]